MELKLLKEKWLWLVKDLALDSQRLQTQKIECRNYNLQKIDKKLIQSKQ